MVVVTQVMIIALVNGVCCQQVFKTLGVHFNYRFEVCLAVVAVICVICKLLNEWALKWHVVYLLPSLYTPLPHVCGVRMKGTVLHWLRHHAIIDGSVITILYCMCLKQMISPSHFTLFKIRHRQKLWNFEKNAYNIQCSHNIHINIIIHFLYDLSMLRLNLISTLSLICSSQLSFINVSNPLRLLHISTYYIYIILIDSYIPGYLISSIVKPLHTGV